MSEFEEELLKALEVLKKSKLPVCENTPKADDVAIETGNNPNPKSQS